MKPTYFNQVSEFTLTQLTALVDSIEKEKSVSQKNMIKQYSPFSNEINQSISTSSLCCSHLHRTYNGR